MKKIEFKNLPDKTTPINSTNLNKIQDNIEEVFEGNESMGSIVVEDITCKNLCNGISQGYYLTTAGTSFGRTATDNGLVIEVEENTDYTISTTDIQTRYRIAFTNTLLSVGGSSNDVYNALTKDGTKENITRNSGNYKYLIVNATDLSKIQVEKGNKATDYTPYKKIGYNSTDSMGSIVVEDITCKNMLDFDSITKYNRDLSSSPTVGSALSFYTETKALQFYIPATNLRGKTLTYSNSSKYSNYIRIFELDSNYKYIKTVSRVGFTVGATTSYLCVILKEATAISTAATDIEAQLEKGKVATDYVEHKEFSNKETKSVSLWSGRVYESGSILTLRKPLEIGNIYIIEFYGLSGLYKSYETFIYTGNKYVQLNYYSSPDSTGFRYRLECEGNTITISNESVGNVNNSAITNIYEITSS